LLASPSDSAVLEGILAPARTRGAEPEKHWFDSLSFNRVCCDGAGFTSTACQNPTLTIMTLCVRSMDYLMGEMKRGNI